MDTCTIEVGLLRKKPCGSAGVARCDNCEQPLCVEHAVAQLTDAGHKSGKFMCKECVAAAKTHAKTMTSVAKTQEERKNAALAAETRQRMAEPPAPIKKPTAPAPAAGAPAEAAPAEKPAESAPLEFTPSKK